MNSAVSADYKIKVKESMKIDKYLDLAWKQKRL